MRKSFLLAFLFSFGLFQSSTVFAQEIAEFEGSEDIAYCYADGTCIPADQTDESESLRAVIPGPAGDTTSSSVVMTLQKLNFSIKQGSEPVSGKCVGLPIKLDTTENGVVSTENFIFYSMPTDVYGKISMVLSHSGVTGTCIDESTNKTTTFTMTFTTSSCGIETPISAWPVGCCQLILNSGMKFCYSAPNIWGYSESLCATLNKIFQCRGLGYTVWHPDAKCNYATGLCEDNTLIELAKLDAVPFNRAVKIIWTTASEIDTTGFNIYRSDSTDGEYLQVNAALIPAQGSPSSGASYEFMDTSVQNKKTYYYKLEDVDLNGVAAAHGPVSAMPRFIYSFTSW